MANIPTIPNVIGNEISTTLSSSVSNSDLSWTVASAAGMNTSGGFLIIDEGTSSEEVVYVQSISGNILTIADNGRGLSGTTASSHNQGALITDIIVAEMFDYLSDEATNIRADLENEHNADGTHKQISSSLTASGTAISTSNKIIDAAYPITTVGAINLWATSTAPTGWLICNGSAVSRTTYSALFAVLSTSYGSGDGSTTFNLPNLTGRVPVGYSASDTEFDTLGETGGAKTHTLSLSEIPSHRHQVLGIIDNNAFSGGTDWGGKGGNSAIYTDYQGGGGAHNNLQPYITLNYIIKY